MNCRVFILVLCLLMLIVASSSAQNLLNNPESVVFDQATGTYLVSNWGDGNIIRYYPDGTQEYYNRDFEGVYQIAGLYIYGDTLLAASGNGAGAGLSMFDLPTGGLINHISLPDVGLPNDIAVDSSGIIFVTDYWDSKLYRVQEHVPSVVMTAGLNYPNGMLYDAEEHRLLIINVNQPRVPVRQLSLGDTTLSLLGYTDLPGGDGIVMDSDRFLYISEWTYDSVHKFDIDFAGDSEVFSSGHDAPADIYIDPVNNLLAVPNFSSNTVDFVSFTSIGERLNNNTGLVPASIQIESIWPNPFNNIASMNYSLPVDGLVSITMYSLDGRVVDELYNGFQASGQHNVVLDSRHVASGTYYIIVQQDSQCAVGSAILLK